MQIHIQYISICVHTCYYTDWLKAATVTLTCWWTNRKTDCLEWEN